MVRWWPNSPELADHDGGAELVPVDLGTIHIHEDAQKLALALYEIDPQHPALEAYWGKE